MLRTTLAGLRMHKGRLVTTALAIILGVTFVSGTLVFTGTLNESFNAQVKGSADGFAAIVLPDNDQGDGSEPTLLSQRTLDDIAALPEVTEAGGVIRGDTPLLDTEGRVVGNLPTAGVSVGDSTRYSAAEGELPADADEVALATGSARETGHGIGDEVQILDHEGAEHTFTVTGLVDFGVGSEFSFTGAVAFDETTAKEMTGVDGLSEINVTGAQGTTDEAVTEAVAAVAGDAEVLTGQEFGQRLAENAGADSQVLTMALMLFALIAMFVASIVIYNTFAILLAQRQRETALLRCVGAGRGQVFRGALLEAVIIGAVSSAVGVLAGIGVGYAGFAIGGETLGATVSSTSVVIGPAVVVAGLAVGTVMTVLAMLVPAIRSTRVPPLAALRTSATAQGLEQGIGWVRIAGGVALFLLAAALVRWAMALSSSGPSEHGLLVVTLGGFAAFLGVFVLGPLLVRAIVAALGAPMRKLGAAGALAADNTRRSPKRAATAMIALTVGAALITGYSVISASMESTITDQLERQFPVDYTITPQFDTETGEGIPPAVAGRLEDSPAIATVITERTAYTGGGEARTDLPVSAYYGGAVGTDVGASLKSGDLSDLAPGKVVVAEVYAEGRDVGATFTVPTEQGERDFEIAAVTAGTDGLWGVTMDPDDFATYFPDATDAQSVSVRAADGAEDDEVHDAVYAAVEDDPTLQVMSTAQLKNEITDFLDTAFLVIAAMLGLSVLIAVFGIANTMALSVLERTRESALLRAMGLAKGQLSRMLSMEAVLLCLIGAVLGVGLGVVFGWAAGTVVLSDLLLTVPVARIALLIAVAVLAGLLASVLPARTAGRTSITGALASE
ncbi:ABC transporter permease [Allosalinactinospora lopnorensis]|uniref:ABC transporter permease n=1 Tax=Allosalinactinospora lopnorensis TaxID=1352348 RepID=UPI000623BA19|nr:ABC transporter permease [Allosalinactinospora lopnorensis]